MKSPISPVFRVTSAVRTCIGFQKQTAFGLAGKLKYDLVYNSLSGLPPTPGFGTNASYYTGTPTLELTQSLWRNGFGSEIRSLRAAVENAQKASHYASRFEGRAILAQAEGAYWKLSLIREAISVRRDSVTRAQRLRDWNQRRVSLDLADKADLLQAEAGLRYRELELRAVLDEERSLSRQFNSLRGIQSDSVPDRLSEPGNRLLDRPADLSDRPVDAREDLVAAAHGRTAAQANARANAEKTKPTLELFGSVSLNSLERSRNDAISQSLKTEKPTLVAGLALSVPLDFGTRSGLRSGYALAAESAEASFERKKFELTQQWEDLNKKYDEAWKRLEIAREMEKIQEQKLAYERERLFRGKTVTFQVLQFEEDYAQSQLARIQSEGEILGLIANLKLFRSAP